MGSKFSKLTNWFDACSSKDFRMMRLLVSSNINPNIRRYEPDGDTPLIESIKTHKDSVIKYLLLHGANVDMIDQNGNTPLMLYIDEYCMTPPYSFSMELLKLFVTSTADLNLQNQKGQTAFSMIYNTPCCNTDMITLFLQNEANPNIQDVDGNTVFHTVYSNPYAELLLKYGANPNIQNHAGETPLMIACSYSKPFEILLEYHADVNLEDESGLNALMKLLYSCPKEIIDDRVQSLLRYSPDINLQTYDGNTAIMIACSRSKLNVTLNTCKMILDAGADLSFKNRSGMDVFEIASHYGHPDVIPLLHSV